MSRKTVVLTADERAICRVRYRQVATYMDPGPQPMTPNDRICQAIAGHWKNGAALEHGSEHSDLLFPFGNKRAVSRHVNKGSPKTVDADREIALAWVDTQPKNVRGEILMLLGLVSKDGEDADNESLDVKVKGEVADVKQEVEEGTSVGIKRKLGDDDDDSKPDVFLKRPRVDPAPRTDVKTEAEDGPVKTEA
ncbi:hypothetical protein C8R47DRAFT_1132473 [Mycena vitilis]|nr:hypothetical protein C8R47DRAFT_1132473 [Mycena vitilis]